LTVRTAYFSIAFRDPALTQSLEQNVVRYERKHDAILIAVAFLFGCLVGLGIPIGGRKPILQQHPQITAAVTHMPDAELTPGIIHEDDTETICKSGYSLTVRHVTAAMRKEVFSRYGITDPKPGEYEIDHLISLELGGANDIRNLWPQRYQGEWNAHMKDRLENKLHKMVCEGDLPLDEAQMVLANDWVEGYEKYISN
jgi:hypothetical protein